LEDDMTEDEVKAIVNAMMPEQLRKHLDDVLPGLIRSDPNLAAALYRDIGARKADKYQADSPHGGSGSVTFPGATVEIPPVTVPVE
jgi:hypothetical protein